MNETFGTYQYVQGIFRALFILLDGGEDRENEAGEDKQKSGWDTHTDTHTDETGRHAYYDGLMNVNGTNQGSNLIQKRKATTNRALSLH